MSLNSVILAVEDSLSDAVPTKILQYFGIQIHVRIPNTYQGNTYLRRRARELNKELLLLIGNATNLETLEQHSENVRLPYIVCSAALV